MMPERVGIPRRTKRPGRRWIGMALIALLALFVFPATAQASSYVPIDGQGSTWDENAIDQWTANVSQYGMDVQFTGNGSSAGRTAFAQGNLVSYAASDIPYGQTDDGQPNPPPDFKFAYVPVVAGGTAFMYHLDVGGRLVTNLRLSGQTITKIFTGALKMWNAPEIQAENPGITLPPIQIVPVVRTDGSGSSAQLTEWMATEFPSMWNDYCHAAGRPVWNPCGATSFYPVVQGSNFVSQSLDSGVAGYVSSPDSNGAITYTEYSYALEADYPVVQLLNSAGYYTLPTSSNDAVSLTKAQIYNNPGDLLTYLTQNLDDVYTDSDPRTYILSSYSYMIIPLTTSPPTNFTTAKGLTLSAFLDYAICQGQQDMGPLGYSPLPINLVEAGFSQIKQIPGAQPQDINVKSCNNPTFSSSGVNLVVQSAPYPAACAKAGPTQCAANGTTAISSTGGGSGGSGAGSGGSGGTSGGSGGAAKGGAGSSKKAVGPSSSASTGPVALGGSGSVQGTEASSGAYNPDVVAGEYFVSSAYSSPLGTSLMILAVGFLIVAVFGPAVYLWIRRRRRS